MGPQRWQGRGMVASRHPSARPTGDSAGEEVNGGDTQHPGSRPHFGKWQKKVGGGGRRIGKGGIKRPSMPHGSAEGKHGQNRGAGSPVIPGATRKTRVGLMW